MRCVDLKRKKVWEVKMRVLKGALDDAWDRASGHLHRHDTTGPRDDDSRMNGKDP